MKNLEWAVVLFGAIFMLWFSFAILIVGRQLYGSDASLIWASGLLSLIGIRGLSNFILFIWNNRK